jgi:voltage-gated potassium channel
MLAQTFKKLHPETVAILDFVDVLVCCFFLADFFKSLLQAPNRKRYFLTWGWLDLLSSIPVLDIGRWGRAARILRIFRVLRGLRAARVMANLVAKRRAQNTAFATVLLALFLLTFCSIAILHFEDVPEGNISTADDALWWAFATITTVGYGDHYPVTGEGRVVAGLLMLGGLGLSGALAGFLAAAFVGEQEDEIGADLKALREEVAELKTLLRERV